MSKATFEYWMDENSRRSAALNRLAPHVNTDEVKVHTNGPDEPTIITLYYGREGRGSPRDAMQHLTFMRKELEAVETYANADECDFETRTVETRLTIAYNWHEDDDSEDPIREDSHSKQAKDEQLKATYGLTD